MMSLLSGFLEIVVLSLLAAGCAGNRATVSEKTYAFSMANAEAKTASLMVASKIQRPLYLVLDPEKVPDSRVLKVEVWGRHRNTIELVELQLFVTRDLKKALENYFERVEVVKSGDPLPEGPGVIAEVKVDRNEDQRNTDPSCIEMTWGLGLRPSEASEYVFSYVGSASSFPLNGHIHDRLARVIESAIMELNKAFMEKGFSNLKTACEVGRTEP